ncbi:MAG: hypothetical protein LM586_03155, partial [Desulfurococcales archaeon]|nr:hypothetical protein [Desulfurococcales archaeon]
VLRLRFIDARVWRYSIAALEDLVETGLMEVNENGLRMKAMDPAHVAMIDFHIPREGFDIFEIEREEKIPVNLEVMIKILRRAGKKDEISLSYEPPNINVGLISPDGIERVFQFTAISGAGFEEIPELSLEFPVEASIIPQAFKSSYKVLSEVGDVIEIIARKDKMLFSSSSELTNVEIELSTETNLLTRYEFKADNDQRSKYTLDYFDKMAKLSMISESIDLYFGEGLPVKVVARLPRGAWLTLYVAPREE